MRKMMKFAIVVAVFACAMSQAAPDREDYDDVDYFDCTGQDGPLHDHPTDCTRFIHCHNGRSADKSCAPCQDTGRYCPEGYLVFDSTIGVCNWPDSTPCHSRDRTTTEGLPTTEEATSTERPATTTTTERPATTTTTERPATTTTTERPATTTTTERPANTTTPSPPGSGDECDPKDCSVQGDCRSYRFCQRVPDANKSPDEEVGRLIENECDHGLWFNPQAANSSVHGGTCDLWVNLPEEIRIEYDRECVCNFFAVGSCSPNYIYQDAEPRGSDNWVNQTLTCPDGLNWNQDRRVCSSDC